MDKMMKKLAVGLLGFALVTGVAWTVQAKDTQNEGNKGKTPEVKENKDAQNDESEPGAEIKGNWEKPTEPKGGNKSENLKKCNGLGCIVHKCTHDWSKYELNLTEAQKKAVKELKDRIDKKTVGMNWCTLKAARHNLETLKKDKRANKTTIAKAKAEVKRIDDGIKAGYKEFNDAFKGQILNAEQRQKFEAREAAQKEHRELCSPKHKPGCPFYRKMDKNNDNGGLMKYCQDDSHLSQGLFECPGYKETKKEIKKEEHKELREKHQEKEQGDSKK
jgi:hypothetical protein